LIISLILIIFISWYFHFHLFSLLIHWLFSLIAITPFSFFFFIHYFHYIRHYDYLSLLFITLS
jgi:hypothetical protein